MELFQLKRTVTFKEATTLGLGALIGAGIFVLIGPATQIAGNLIPWVFLLAALSAFFSAATYSELSTAYLGSLGEYSIAKKIVGDRGAFLIAWLLFSGNSIACSVYAQGFSSFFTVFVPVPLLLASIMVALFICTMNIVGVEKTAKFEFYFTVFLTMALLGLGAGMVTVGDAGNLVPSFREGIFKDVMQSVGIIYIAFFGFQVISSSAEEIIDPVRNIPRSIFVSLAIATVVYVLIGVGVTVISGGEVLGNPALFVESVTRQVFGDWGAMFLVLLGMVATLTSLNSTVLGVSRQMYSIAQDRYIPELLAKIHPRFQTPYLALVMIFIIIVLFLLGGSLTWAANLASFAYLVSLMCMHGVLIVSRFRHKDLERPFRVPLGITVPLLGIVFNAAVLFMLGVPMLIAGMWWACAGVILFELLKRREASIGRIKVLWHRGEHFFQEKILPRFHR